MITDFGFSLKIALVLYTIFYSADLALRRWRTNKESLRVVHWATKDNYDKIRESGVLKAAPYGWWLGSWFRPWEQTIWATMSKTQPKPYDVRVGVVRNYGLEFTIKPGERSYRVSKAFRDCVRVRIRDEGISLYDMERDFSYHEPSVRAKKRWSLGDWQLLQWSWKTSSICTALASIVTFALLVVGVQMALEIWLILHFSPY